jgi:hypothetical protein
MEKYVLDAKGTQVLSRKPRPTLNYDSKITNFYRGYFDVKRFYRMPNVQSKAKQSHYRPGPEVSRK